MATKRCMVYVIDDDESIRKSFKRLFRSANLDVQVFSSADEFLTSRVQAENSCIVLDIRMTGTTGFDLQQRLAAESLPVPVIVVSASDDLQVRETARDLGAVSFFRKPVDDQAVLDAILWAVSAKGKGKHDKDGRSNS